VVAELHRHIAFPKKIKLNPFDVKIFWEHAISVFKQRAASESFIPLLEQPPETVGKVGPIDCSIVELARRENAVLVTMDDGLRWVCDDRNVPVEVITDHLRKIGYP
jgi:hypothetical protein